jgi:hypothetical protein
MRESWRSLAVAATFITTVGAGVATAQTVIVTKVPAELTIEFVANATAVKPTGTDSGGIRFAANLFQNATKVQTDARVYVDRCGKVTRVFLVESALEPPDKAPGCDRVDNRTLFVVRRNTTLVVDLGGTDPTVWLNQGPAPTAWLRPDVEGDHPTRNWRLAPKGLVLSSGWNLAKYSNAVANACGNVTDCTGSKYQSGYALSAGYWVTSFLGAEVSYLKPSNVTSDGSGDNYHFTSFLESRLATIAVKAGVPIGPVRVYGEAGASYSRTKFSTTEVFSDSPGGTETIEMQTKGWGYLIGGGVEGWVVRSIALYAEVGSTAIKGKPMVGEGSINDSMLFATAGVRVRLPFRR